MKFILQLFNRREKVQMLGIFLLMLISGFLEMLGLGMIFPFIGMVTNPKIIHENHLLNFFYDILSFQSVQNFLIAFGIALIFLIVIKNSYYLLSMFIQQNYLIRKRVQVGNLLYMGYLRSDYNFHLQSNSALLLRNTSVVDNIFAGGLQPLFLILSEAVIIVFIVVMLLFTNYLITVCAALFIAPLVWVTYSLFRARLRRLGKESHYFMGLTSKTVLESFGAIKEVLVRNCQDYFSRKFVENSKKLGTIRRDSFILNQMPRLIIEPIVAGSLILLIVFFIFKGKVGSDVFPTIALFATASFRLVISATKIISGMHTIDFHRVLEDTICKELKLFMQKSEEDDFGKGKLIPATKTSFNSTIELRNVSFRYSGGNSDAVHNVSLTINKGQSIAFVGASGAGKSTLIDIFLGLLSPCSGEVCVDGKIISECLDTWRSNIGYVPQDSFLRDETLRHNIAFAVPDHLIDDNAISRAIQVARLSDVVKMMPQGVNTTIGERGIRLSGGQRQRMNIARALYNDPDILIMDEATSALDGETEAEISKAVEELSGEKTIIIIAHRLSTVKECDRVYFMVDGEIHDSGSLQELLERNDKFNKMAGLR